MEATTSPRRWTGMPTSSSDRFRKYSAVVDTGASVTTDVLRPPMAYAPGLLRLLHHQILFTGHQLPGQLSPVLLPVGIASQQRKLYGRQVDINLGRKRWTHYTEGGRKLAGKTLT